MLYILPFILEFLCFYTTLHGFLEISKKPKKNDIDTDEINEIKVHGINC